MIILIPAYEPDQRLVALAASIRAADRDTHVVVVDDGSGERYRAVFDEVRALGCTVIGHPANRGKGYALKSGFDHVATYFPGEDVVCADCDGQHVLVDILRVADRLSADRQGADRQSADRQSADQQGADQQGVDQQRSLPSARGTRGTRAAMVLGARRFTGRVPARSRFGNAVTGVVFRLATRLPVRDTQTGLRGYPASMLDWLLTVDGDRFEYELNLLLRAADAGYEVEEVEIATIYLAGNESSHFRPVADSVRIYAPLLKFSLSSFAAFLLDTVALLVLDALTGSLLVSVVGARAASSTANFLANRRLVFAHGTRTPVRVAAARYWGLAAALLAANYGLMSVLTGAGLALLPAKVVTEVVLFAVSYQVQRRFVFARRFQDRSETVVALETRLVDEAA